MDDVYDRGQIISSSICQLYALVLEKLGANLTKKFFKDATQEEKDSFINKLKERQIDQLSHRMEDIMNRILADHQFLEAYDKIMGPCKNIEELRQDNKIANNHLQSVENERSILQRDTDMAIDKLDTVCEAIMSD